MKNIFFLFLTLPFLLISCASANKSTGKKISLPVAGENSSNLNIIKNAAKTKIRIFNRDGVSFDFFYGNKGSYFIILSQENDYIDLNNYDVSLIIESDRELESPEFISLSIEDDRVLSGYGSIRDGNTSFILILYPTDPSLNKKLEIPFKAEIRSLF